jgi:hypothetical protein
VPSAFVLPAGLIGSGSTREQYRKRIGQRVGRFYRGTVTDQANELDADRTVLSRTLRSDVGPMSRLDGLYCYLRSGSQAGAQRAVIDGTFDGPQATLMLDAPFSAPLRVGDEYELAQLPAEDYLGVGGLNTRVYDALSSVWIRDRLAFTGDGGYAYDLLEWPWLASDDQIVGLLDRVLVSPSGNPLPSRSPWRIRYQGSTHYLETDLSYPIGTPFEVEVFRPSNTLIRSGGAWGSGDGLQHEDDEAIPPVSLIAAIGLCFTYQEMLGRAQWLGQSAPSLAYLEREYQRWTKTAARLKWEYLPYEIVEASAPLVRVSYGSGWMSESGRPRSV